MSNTKNNVQNSPGTSDHGQLAASTTPYLPPQPAPAVYQPIPSPEPVMGRELVEQVASRKAAYSAFSAGLHGFDENAERQAVANHIYEKYGAKE